jgi:DNA-binding CsgD family transcriptional regulator
MDTIEVHEKEFAELRAHVLRRDIDTRKMKGLIESLLNTKARQDTALQDKQAECKRLRAQIRKYEQTIAEMVPVRPDVDSDVMSVESDVMSVEPEPVEPVEPEPVEPVEPVEPPSILSAYESIKLYMSRYGSLTTIAERLGRHPNTLLRAFMDMRDARNNMAHPRPIEIPSDKAFYEILRSNNKTI